MAVVDQGVAGFQRAATSGAVAVVGVGMKALDGARLGAAPAPRSPPAFAKSAGRIRTRPWIPSHMVHRARRMLARLAPGAGLQAVLVSSLNGGETARLSMRPDRVDGRGLAAMAGSMMAMARAVGREVQWPACRRLTFETPEGVAVFLAIEGPVPCVLCLLHDSRAPLERVLWLAAEVARALESP